jgi:hypothetical protein
MAEAFIQICNGEKTDILSNLDQCHKQRLISFLEKYFDKFLNILLG